MKQDQIFSVLFAYCNHKPAISTLNYYAFVCRSVQPNLYMNKQNIIPFLKDEQEIKRWLLSRGPTFNSGISAIIKLRSGFYKQACTYLHPLSWDRNSLCSVWDDALVGFCAPLSWASGIPLVFCTTTLAQEQYC